MKFLADKIPVHISVPIHCGHAHHPHPGGPWVAGERGDGHQAGKEAEAGLPGALKKTMRTQKRIFPWEGIAD